MSDFDFSPLRYVDCQLRDGENQRVDWPTYAVIGDPIAHSLSPRLHSAALRAHRLDATYRAIAVTGDELESFLAEALLRDLRGVNVTIPHKQTIAPLCASLSEEAKEVGAVNTMVRRQDSWQGHNTDARGLSLALKQELGRSLRHALESVVVVGAGGAARAAWQSMLALGAGTVTVVARNPARAAWATSTRAHVRSLEEAPLGSASLVLQATPLGLAPEDPSPIEVARLPATCFVMDLTYGDTPSRLLREARAHGCRTQDGLPMLIGQAALAFTLWHGALAPLRVMAEAVDRTWS